MKSITFIFPHPVDGPTGGYKVVFEYANRLVQDGYEVYLVYSGSIFWSKKNAFHKLTNCIRYIQNRIKGVSCRGWFDIDKRVHELYTLSMNYRHVPKTDIYIATSPYTAWYLNEYPVDKTKKYYFIQGKEDWGPGIKAILYDTYHFELNKIVISNWLHNMLKNEHGEEAVVIPNGFDFEKFRLTNPIASRNPYIVSMLYHSHELKDCNTGFKALEAVKSRFPQLQVNIFGVPERPSKLPEWYNYTQCPSTEEHLRINNESAIFLGTSKQEGWGLTVGEAMICGEAVVCTDNPGYLEMAVDGRNALVVPVGDADAMAASIIRLIEDKELRIKLAEQAAKDIARFTWSNSYERFKTVIFHEENK